MSWELETGGMHANQVFAHYAGQIAKGNVKHGSPAWSEENYYIREALGWLLLVETIPPM